MDSPAGKLWNQFIDPSDSESDESKIGKPSIYDALYSPFIVALVSGNLQPESFNRHVAGALQILGATAEAYERIAEGKNLSAKAKAAISELRGGIVEEQKSILKELKELEIDVSIESPSSEAARKYCTFIKAAARPEGIPAYLLATVAPFVSLSVYLAHQLKEAADARYMFWINRNCLSLPIWTETVLNCLCEENAQLNDGVLRYRYNQGMLFVLDFFLTPVSIDECSIVPLIRELDASRDKILIFCGFESFCCYYTEKMIAQMLDVLPIVKVGFVHDNVHNALSKLAGLFAGFQVKAETHRDIVKIFTDQSFRDLIEAADTSKMIVNAHLMSSVSSDICTVHKNLGSSSLKLKRFREVLKKGSNKKLLTIYIGKGVDDLECLLEADIGITFDPCSEFLYLCNQLGISFVMLWETVLDKQKQMRKGIHSLWKSKSGTVYVVRSWNEVAAFVFGALNKDYTPKITTSEENITLNIHNLPKLGRQSTVFRLADYMGYENRNGANPKKPPETKTELQNPVPLPINVNPAIGFNIGDKRELKKKPPETKTLPDDLQTSVSAPPSKEKKSSVALFLKNLPKAQNTNQTIDVAEEQDASKKVEEEDRKQAVEQDVSKKVEEEDRKQAVEQDVSKKVEEEDREQAEEQDVQKVEEEDLLKHGYEQVDKEEDEPAGDI